MRHTPRIPQPVEIDGTRYEPMVIQRDGVPAWTGRWVMLVRPTPIAWGISWHFNRTNLGSLSVLMANRDLPKQLR